MVYLHGEGDIFPRLEKALEGHFAGEGFTIHLEPEEAFGEYDADAIRCIPVENFAHPERLEVGELVDEVPGEAPDGRPWRVTDMADGMAVLEANHPLAGVGLQFAVKVLDVHEPSEAELESMEDDGSASLVPPFLRLADKIVSEDDDDDTPYEAADGESAAPTATDRPWLSSPSHLASCVKVPAVCREANGAPLNKTNGRFRRSFCRSEYARHQRCMVSRVHDCTLGQHQQKNLLSVISLGAASEIRREIRKRLPFVCHMKGLRGGMFLFVCLPRSKQGYPIVKCQLGCNPMGSVCLIWQTIKKSRGVRQYAALRTCLSSF